MIHTNSYRKKVAKLIIGLAMMGAALGAIVWAMSTGGASNLTAVVENFLSAKDSKELKIDWTQAGPGAGPAYLWATVRVPENAESPGGVVRLRVSRVEGIVDMAVWDEGGFGIPLSHPVDQETAAKRALQFAQAHFPGTWTPDMELVSVRLPDEVGGDSYVFNWTRKVRGGLTGHWCMVSVRRSDGLVVFFAARAQPVTDQYPEVNISAADAREIATRHIDQYAAASAFARCTRIEVAVQQPYILWSTRDAEVVPVWAVPFEIRYYLPEDRRTPGHDYEKISGVVDVHGITGEILNFVSV